MKSGRNGILLLMVAVGMLMSCNRYVFAPKGFIVNGDPTYYNDSLQIVVVMAGDYQNYVPDSHTGFRVHKFFSKRDKQLLRRMRVDKSRAVVLFSGKPVFEPFFNVIAYLTPEVDFDTVGYQTRYVGGEPAFRYKTETVKKIAVAHSVIPFKGGYLNLLHYQNEAEFEFCPNCDILSISERNVQKIRKNEPYSLGYADCGCTEVVKDSTTNFSISGDSLLRGTESLLKVYEMPLMQLVCFKRLTGKERAIQLDLCPGTYFLRYTDLRNKTKWSKELLIQ